MWIYLDNASTTPIRPEVRAAMEPWLSDEYGNPSSHHELGQSAAEAVRDAREVVASMIGARPDEIFFTSGGSEANSWAINGLYCIDNGGHILMSAIEHHSLLNNRHRKELIGVNEYGVVNLAELNRRINFNTPIVAVMMANNEIGTIEPIDRIDQICYEHMCFLHVDAVQAFGHIPINVKNYMAVSTMSASAHKIYGPKGVGFLYIQRDVQLLYHPIIIGGQQEFGMRGGTENVAGIIGFAKACELAQKEMEDVYDRNRTCIIRMWNEFRKFEGTHLNGFAPDSEDRLPNNLSVSFDEIRAEELLELLSEDGVYVSSGSACNSDSDEPSHVLTAIGLSEDRANSTIRISLGYHTSIEEVDRALNTIIKDVRILRGR